MRRIIFRIVVLFLVFAASAFVCTSLMNQEKTENAEDMSPATLPVMYMKVGDTLINRMYGYRTEMEGSTLRDTLTPLPMDRSLTLAIRTQGKAVDSVTYTVESVDGSEIVENSSIRNLKTDGDLLVADFHLDTPIRMRQEYILRFELNLGGGDSAWYYTRVVQRTDTGLENYLAFVTMFYESCVNKDQAAALTSYIEPNESGNNTSFIDVDIHSDLEHISWGTLAPVIVQKAVPTVREVNETTVSISQEYVISANDGDGGTEYYTVSEFYRMRQSTDRVVLLDFERSAVQIFDSELPVLTRSGINLGVTGRDTPYVTNVAADIVAFVVNGDLWSYNRSANKCTRIFSFRGEHMSAQDERENNPSHGIHVVRVSDSGDVTFVVYGYMNRGSHEGESGVAVYDYSAERNVAEEALFVPATSSFAFLADSLKRLSYVSRDDQMYLYLNEALYQISLDTGEYEILKERIPKDGFVVSDSQASVAWIEGTDVSAASEITVLSLETLEPMTVSAGEGQKIRALGFIHEDFVCGVANTSDITRDISGNEMYPMHTIRILGLDGEVKKEYSQSGYYITGVRISEGLLELDRVVRTDSGYTEAAADHIMNGEQQSQETVTSRMAVMEERKGQQFLLEFASGRKSGSLLKLVPKYVETELETEVVIGDLVPKSGIYYVYGHGRLLDICTSPADAILLADEYVGVVLDARQAYVWERGNLQTSVSLDVGTQPAAFQQASLDVNTLQSSLGSGGTLLNLTGCSLEQVKYMLSSGRGVVVKTSETESRLMAGYDQFGNIYLYDAATGETAPMGPNDSQALFAANGNVFISFMKGPES